MALTRPSFIIRPSFFKCIFGFLVFQPQFTFDTIPQFGRSEIPSFRCREKQLESQALPAEWPRWPQHRPGPDPAALTVLATFPTPGPTSLRLLGSCRLAQLNPHPSHQAPTPPPPGIGQPVPFSCESTPHSSKMTYSSLGAPRPFFQHLSLEM